MPSSGLSLSAAGTSPLVRLAKWIFGALVISFQVVSFAGQFWGFHCKDVVKPQVSTFDL